MSRRERDKGVAGEREVAAMYEALGFEVRGLEGAGDHLIVCDLASELVLHSEVKRHETARPWAWDAQAEAEAPAGTLPVVHFRRSRSPWLVQLRAERFVTVLSSRRTLAVQLEAARRALEVSAGGRAGSAEGA